MSGSRATPMGMFACDPSGLWHYHTTRAGGTADTFAPDALEHKPIGPAWFWFNGVPVPILDSDTVRTLSDRSYEWRLAYYEDPQKLLALFKEMSAPTRKEH